MPSSDCREERRSLLEKYWTPCRHEAAGRPMLLCVQCAARVRPAFLPRLYRGAAVSQSRPEDDAKGMSNYNWAPETPGRNVRIQAFLLARSSRHSSARSTLLGGVGAQKLLLTSDEHIAGFHASSYHC